MSDAAANLKKALEVMGQGAIEEAYLAALTTALNDNGWVYLPDEDIPDCDDCDERMGEPMRNEGYD